MTTAKILADALDMATDHGARGWIRQPSIVETQWGHDLKVGDTTYRLAVDDTEVRMFIFTNGPAMLVEASASVTANLAHMLVVEIAERIR